MFIRLAIYMYNLRKETGRRQVLRGHAYVKSFEEGGDKKGGEGVTVAKLKSD